MKISFIFAFILSALLISCGDNNKEEFQAFNAEAFAFHIGEGWEVNASTRVKGFEQNEKEGNFSASFSYSLDIIIPAGDTVKSLITRAEDINQTEQYADAPLEVQFELDTTYVPGNYKLVFNVKDVNSGQTAASEAAFELQN